jgi:hypothetical protein
MSEETKKTPEELEKEKMEEFLKIYGVMGEVVYTTTTEELTKVLTDILTMGSFTKTFSIFNSRLEMTFESITEKERMNSYDLVRKFIDSNKSEKDGATQLSQAQIEAYRAKVNVALQLLRIKVSTSPINLREKPLEERIMFFSETPEDVMRTYSKYLMIFANITAKAFSSEDILKN